MTEHKNSFDDIKKSMVDRAFADAEAHLAQELPEPTEQHEFSDRHNAKMKKLFKSMDDKYAKATPPSKSIRWIAACFLAVVIIGCTLTLPPVEAWRERIFDFVFETDQPNTDFTQSGNDGFDYDDDYIYLDYVPVGFEVSDSYYDNSQYSLSFKNNSRSFQISILKSYTQMSIDTEKGQYESITINGNQAIYTANDNINSIIFEAGEKTVIVLGDINKTELIKIATNLKIRF